MIGLNVFRTILKPPCISASNLTIKRFRKPSICSFLDCPTQKPRFNICDVKILRADQTHGNLIGMFLREQYWTREPSVCSLWMDLENDYVRILNDKYSYTGDRYLAMEPQERTGESKLIGVVVANRIYPWGARELEEWADATPSIPEQSRMYFYSHCYSNPNLWQKYNVDYIYEIEVLTTAGEVTGQGVATLLLKHALQEALLQRHPLIQFISTSAYASKVCERCGMKQEWSMQFLDFVDNCGQSIFYPRTPHTECKIFIKRYNQLEVFAEPCLPESW